MILGYKKNGRIPFFVGFKRILKADVNNTSKR